MVTVLSKFISVPVCFICFDFFDKMTYRICPNRSACPNRRAPPCSKKHITSNSHQMPDKTLKDCHKTVKNIKIRAVFRSVWLPHMRKSPLPCKQRSTRFLFTVYMRIVGTGRQGLLLKLIDVHPSSSLHSRTVLQLGHTRYLHWSF